MVNILLTARLGDPDSIMDSGKRVSLLLSVHTDYLIYQPPIWGFWEQANYWRVFDVDVL